MDRCVVRAHHGNMPTRKPVEEHRPTRESIVEEALMELVERAAALRAWAFAAAIAVDAGLSQNRRALNGIGAIAEDVETLAARVRASLSAEALDSPLRSQQ
jgi:hypothetical protein